jgi:hypothetical protein
MDSLSSVMDMFYNALPGIYFMLLTEKYTSFKLISSLTYKSDFGILILISIGLLLGFTFQILTKFIRHLFLDNKIINNLTSKNSETYKIYDRAKFIINKRGLLDEKLLEDKKQYIYLMDNYLNTSKSNVLPTYYSSRNSLWANLFWANLVFLILLIIEGSNQTLLIHLIIGLLIICVFSFYHYLKVQWDTVIKSFVMEKSIFEELNEKRTKK